MSRNSGGEPRSGSLSESDGERSGSKAVPARLDADGTAKPLTRLVGHVVPGNVQGPGITRPDSYETETGERIPLANEPEGTAGVLLELRDLLRCIEREAERYCAGLSLGHLAQYPVGRVVLPGGRPMNWATDVMQTYLDRVKVLEQRLPGFTSPRTQREEEVPQ